MLLGRLQVALGSVELRPRRGSPELQRWPESFGRSLDNHFLIEAFLCQVWLFSVLLGRLQVAPGGIELRPRRSQEVRGSPELQNDGLRALEEAWMTTFRFRHFSVKSGGFLCFWGDSGWLHECPTASKKLLGGQGKPRPAEQWSESSGRSLDDDFPVEALFCQVGLFSVLLERLRLAPGVSSCVQGG